MFPNLSGGWWLRISALIDPEHTFDLYRDQIDFFDPEFGFLAFGIQIFTFCIYIKMLTNKVKINKTTEILLYFYVKGILEQNLNCKGSANFFSSVKGF